MALKWPSMCRCAVKKLLTHSLTLCAIILCFKLLINIMGHLLCSYTTSFLFCSLCVSYGAVVLVWA